MAPHSSIYTPLETERWHIRLVTIHPKNQVSQQIKCDLETYSLDEQLDYEALSYVWGEKGSEIEILLNGQVFPVRRNLAFALKDLRLADRPRRLWIDAICINQGDHEERASQVLLMRHIYRNASRVVVWLGICTPENVSALNLLRSVKEVTQWGGFEASGMPSQSGIVKVQNYLDTDMSAKKALPYLFRDLLMQAWWERVWVIQEVAVSSKATVIIGDSELEWSFLHDAISIIYFAGVLPTYIAMAETSELESRELKSISSLANIAALRKSIKQGSLPSISTLVASSRQAATDPRDLVYAFLGLARECDHPLLTPNYLDSNTALVTFINLIQYSVRIEKNLNIICMSQGRTRNDFPSWCPDWTNPRDSTADVFGKAPNPLIPTHMNFLANNPWHACGDKSPVAKIIRSPLTLACKGLLVDVIEVIGNPIVMTSLNQVVTGLHSWESLILNRFKGLKSKMTQPADGRSVFDVSDQCHRLVLSLFNCYNIGPRGIPSTMVYRRLQKLRRKAKVLFQGFCSQYITGESLAEAYVRTLITNRLPDDNVMTDNDYRLFWSKVPKLPNDSAPSPALFPKTLVETMVHRTWARTLVLTKKGYLGLGPRRARGGDLVCILYGCSVPVIIRKYGQGYRFVGESYIHGLMDGAAVNQQSLRDTLEERVFILE